jgi:hypothetical protein
MTPAANATSPKRFDWVWVLAWTLVFVGNLPVPLIMGLTATRCGGRIGLAGGLAVVYWVGLVLNGWRFRVGRPLTLGGVWVVALQILPALQLSSGYLAWWGWTQVSGVELGTPVTAADGGAVLLTHNVGAFVVVLVTALPLGTVAVLVDTFERWLRGEFAVVRGDG